MQTNNFAYPPWFNSTRIYHRTQNIRTLFQLFWVQGLPEPDVVSLYSLTHSEFPALQFTQVIRTHISFQLPHQFLATSFTSILLPKKLLFPIHYSKDGLKKEKQQNHTPKFKSLQSWTETSGGLKALPKGSKWHWNWINTGRLNFVLKLHML